MTKKDPVNLDITLQQLQAYVWQANIDRGFAATEDATKKLVMLMEEVGELAKAVRKTAGITFASGTMHADVEEELADVQIVLLGLASMLDVNMITAVQKKEQKNRSRIWR